MPNMPIADALEQGYIHVNDDGVATQMHGPKSVMETGAQYIRDLESLLGKAAKALEPLAEWHDDPEIIPLPEDARVADEVLTLLRPFQFRKEETNV